MKEMRCLYCYQPLGEGENDFHGRCSKQFFGSLTPPVLPYSKEQMEELAQQIVLRSIAVTGVQPKLSLTIEKQGGDPKRSRLTIVGLWGDYILKPPTDSFPQLPQNEDLTMHLAALFGIATADHGLVRLQSGELAYITRRFDRAGGEKLPLEDMCQLTETMTADKYRGSMEKVGKQVWQHTTRPGLEALRLFELTLFCFLTGNADMHLKNFSLLTTEQNEIVLAPAYDLVSTKLAMPEDKEELALTLNARKAKLQRRDFDLFASALKIPPKTLERCYARFSKKIEEAVQMIHCSFLDSKSKEEYMDILRGLGSRVQLSASN